MAGVFICQGHLVSDTHRVDGLCSPADGCCQQVWHVEVGFAAGGLTDADRLVSQLQRRCVQRGNKGGGEFEFENQHQDDTV